MDIKDIDYLNLMLEMKPLVNALEENGIENDCNRSLAFYKELEAVLGNACSLEFFYFDKYFFFPLYAKRDNRIAVLYVTKQSSPEQDKDTEVCFKHFNLWFTVKDFSDKKKFKEMIKQQLEKPEHDPTELSVPEMIYILKKTIDDTCFTFPEEQELQTMFMKLVKGCRK